MANKEELRGAKTKGAPIRFVPVTTSPRGSSDGESIVKDFFIAFGFSLGLFLVVWGAMIIFIELPCPRFIHRQDDWNFWSRLIISFFIVIILLAVANSVASKKSRWTRGISWSLFCIFTCWTVAYYGNFRDTKKTAPHEIRVIEGVKTKAFKVLKIATHLIGMQDNNAGSN